MFTQAEYINGWLAYVAAAIVCYWCFWYFLSKLPVKPLRPVLLGAMAGLLFIPWTVEPNHPFLAPAWLIAGSDGAFEGLEAFWRAGKPLLFGVGLLACLGLVVQIVLALCRPAPKAVKAPAQRRTPTVARAIRP